MSEIQLDQVKHIIAVASGKGGVGKSTIAANLALALSLEGHSVGLLDADIYGPSQGLIMGVPDSRQPDVEKDKLLPILVDNVQCMSMSFITTERTPAIWRGPMASGALQQLLVQTAWKNLDYLIIDMPPGTGDIHLTLVQKVPLTGAVVVTTPQKIALLDAVKGIEMFRKVEVPLLGIIENMSFHLCSECGHSENIFGSGGGSKLTQDYETVLLGQLPLSSALRDQAGGGKSPLLTDTQGDISKLMRQIALLLTQQVENLETNQPVIQIVKD